MCLIAERGIMTSPIPFEKFDRFPSSRRRNSAPLQSIGAAGDRVQKPAPSALAARAVAKLAFANADLYDHDGAFPEAEIAELHQSGLLEAPLPRTLGGFEPTAHELAEWLRHIGSGSLPLGRLYEGHVNALGLVVRFGTESQAAKIAAQAREGRLFGVWNTDDARGVHLIRDGRRWRLEGRKILCSGAGWIRRPVITATDETGQRLMLTPALDGVSADLSQWTAHGMRASATGAVDFTGLLIEAEDIIGHAGDYERQPFFSGGAWRFCAVHLGGMEKLFGLLRQHLNRTGRGGDPHQAARLGEAGICVETARLWVERAAEIAEDRSASVSSEQVVAYVNLARLAVERAGLSLMEHIHRSVGLQAFMRPNPIERITRDLSTYLRQPGPDRALTNAAAWILTREDESADLWS
jgi:alkylation response protein AidB-like acyl-CoA dehydrogenase